MGLRTTNGLLRVVWWIFTVHAVLYFLSGFAALYAEEGYAEYGEATVLQLGGLMLSAMDTLQTHFPKTYTTPSGAVVDSNGYLVAPPPSNGSESE